MRFRVLPIALLLAACASPQPVLYPNATLEREGTEVAEIKIAECQLLAEDSGAADSDSEKMGEIVTDTAIGAGAGGAAGAAGGAVRGHAGRGAGVGAAAAAAGTFVAGGLRWMFGRRPDRIKQRFVERCLMERGYVVVGWK
jgi:hypothetical protein